MAFAIPILPVEDTQGSGFKAFRLIEESGQTFLQGTPVAITAADGGIAAWVANTQGPGQGGLSGISYEAASNLGTTGAGAPAPMQPFTGVGAVAGTFGSVPNQTSAKNISHGAPLNDGRVGFILPSPTVVFCAAFGNGGAAATPAATDVGKQYGLTKDTNNYWYVDKAKTTAGTNTVLTIVSLDLRFAAAAGSLVWFTFLQNVVNLIA